MKKFGGIAICLVSVLLLSGCGTKTLKCTNSMSSGGTDIEYKSEVKFKGDKPTSASINMKVIVDEEYAGQMDQLKELMLGEFDELKEKGFKIKSSTKGNVINVTVSGNAKDSDEFNGTYDEVKEQLEDEGFTCK